jgi:hypothetical protein
MFSSSAIQSMIDPPFSQSLQWKTFFAASTVTHRWKPRCSATGHLCVTKFAPAGKKENPRWRKYSGSGFAAMISPRFTVETPILRAGQQSAIVVVHTTKICFRKDLRSAKGLRILRSQASDDAPVRAGVHRFYDCPMPSPPFFGCGSYLSARAMNRSISLRGIINRPPEVITRNVPS